MLQGASNFLLSNGYYSGSGIRVNITFASNETMYASAYWFMKGNCSTRIVLKRKITFKEYMDLKAKFCPNKGDTILIHNFVEMIKWGE